MVLLKRSWPTLYYPLWATRVQKERSRPVGVRQCEAFVLRASDPNGAREKYMVCTPAAAIDEITTDVG